MSLDPIYGNLTNIVHEDKLPNQKKNAHFLPVGEPAPDGIKILENSVSCVFFILYIFMKPLASSAPLYIFCRDLLLGVSILIPILRK